MSDFQTEINQILKAEACFALPDRRIYRISGEDHLRYMHGRITQDVNGLAIGESAQSLLLSPQGKIQGQFSFIKRQQDLILVCDALTDDQVREDFEHFLMLFKVADDVSLEDISDNYRLIRLHSPDDNRRQELNSEAGNIKDALILKYQSGSILDVLVPTSSLDSVVQSLRSKFNFQNDSDYQLFRILSSEPEFPTDINEKITGPEISIENKVSFSKGCYSGQEVVEMTIARGRPNKQLRLIRIDSEIVIERGEEIQTKDGAKKCGNITSVPTGLLNGARYCLGFCKSSVEPGSDLLIAGAEAVIVESTVASD